MPLAMADSTTTVVVCGLRSMVSKRLINGKTKARPPRIQLEAVPALAVDHAKLAGRHQPHLGQELDDQRDDDQEGNSTESLDADSSYGVSFLALGRRLRQTGRP